MTARISVIDDGLAMNLFCVTAIVNSISVESSFKYMVRATYNGEVTLYEEDTKEFDRQGYNIFTTKFPVSKASYVEVEIVEVNDIDVIHFLSVSSNSGVVV